METYKEIRTFFIGLGMLLDHLGEMDTFIEGQDFKKGYNEHNYEELKKLVDLCSPYVKEPYFDWLDLFMIDKTQDQIKTYIFDLFGNVLKFNDQDFCEMLEFAGVTISIIDDEISINRPNPDKYISEQSETITKAIAYLYRTIMILATTIHNMCMVHGIETLQLQDEYDKLMKNIAFDGEDVGMADDYFTSKLLFTPIAINEEIKSKKTTKLNSSEKLILLNTLMNPKNEEIRERWKKNTMNKNKGKILSYLFDGDEVYYTKHIVPYVNNKDHEPLGKKIEAILKECSLMD